MASPVVTQVVARGSGLFGKLFSFLFKYKLASLFVIYTFITILSFGFSTGDWNGAVIQFGEELINPLQDVSNKLNDLNSGVTGLLDSIIKYSLVYFAFYKIWLWFRLSLIFVNFLMKDANAPLVRYLIAFLFFSFLFLFVSAFYSASVLGESMFYPFTLTKEIYTGLLQLFLNPQFSTDFNLFGEAVNTCTDSICMA